MGTHTQPLTDGDLNREELIETLRAQRERIQRLESQLSFFLYFPGSLAGSRGEALVVGLTNGIRPPGWGGSDVTACLGDGEERRFEVKYSQVRLVGKGGRVGR